MTVAAHKTLAAAVHISDYYTTNDFLLLFNSRPKYSTNYSRLRHVPRGPPKEKLVTVPFNNWYPVQCQSTEGTYTRQHILQYRTNHVSHM